MKNRPWFKALVAGFVGAAVLALLAVLCSPPAASGLRFWLFLVLGGLALGLGHYLDRARADRASAREAWTGSSGPCLRVTSRWARATHAREVTEDIPGFRRVLRSFQNVITYLQDTSESVSTASGQHLRQDAGPLPRGARTRWIRVTRPASSIHQLDRDIEKVVESVDTLSSFTEETGSAILEMRASSEEVMASTHNLTSFVDEIGASIEEMARSVQEVAENAESLSSFAIENASAMVEMDATIGQIEENIRETEELSQQVAAGRPGRHERGEGHGRRAWRRSTPP